MRTDASARAVAMAVLATCLVMAGWSAVTAPVAEAVPAPVGAVTSYPVGTEQFTTAGEIAVGSDGALWFTSPGATPAIRRMATDGTVTAFTDPALGRPRSIAAGPDGALWFTDLLFNSIGRITTAGVITTYATPGIDVDQIVAGPDGAMWFSSPATFPGSIGRITMAGVMTEFVVAGAPHVKSLTAGPDGAIWFLATSYGFSSNTELMGRMAMDGSSVTYTIQGALNPFSITNGPDGALWFTDSQRGSLERVDPQGVRTSFVRPGLHNAGDVTVGPDGALWVTLFESGTVGRMTTDGAYSTFSIPDMTTTTLVSTGPDGGVWFSASTAAGIDRLARIQVIGAPTAPDAVTAIAGTGTATVSWAPPSAEGGSPVTSYVVTASPGGATCSWASGPRSCTVSGLALGTSYQFSVTATSAAGTSPPSSPSSPVLPRAGASYHPVAPTRVLDSRTAVGGWGTPLTDAPAGRALALDPNVVPSSASAVIMNVTMTEAFVGYLTVWPSGAPKPNASNLNYAGRTIANLVTVQVGTNHSVQFATSYGTAEVVADVVGWFDDGSGAGARYTPTAPTRVLDSRLAPGPWDGKLAAGAPRDLALSGLPADATAVIANVTVTNSTDASYLTVWPAGVARPTASNLNFAAGETIPNLAVVPIGAERKISFATNVGATDVVVDVVGWFSPTGGSKFHAMNPERVLDDRFGIGVNGAWDAGPRTLTITPPLPADATGLIANVTATNATANSFVRVYAAGQPLPTASNLNFAAFQTIPNLVMTQVGTDHGVVLHNATGNVDLVADAVGYYAPT
jgi:streptogramin lyase